VEGLVWESGKENRVGAAWVCLIMNAPSRTRRRVIPIWNARPVVFMLSCQSTLSNLVGSRLFLGIDSLMILFTLEVERSLKKFCETLRERGPIL